MMTGVVDWFFDFDFDSDSDSDLYCNLQHNISFHPIFDTEIKQQEAEKQTVKYYLKQALEVNPVPSNYQCQSIYIILPADLTQTVTFQAKDHRAMNDLLKKARGLSVRECDCYKL